MELTRKQLWYLLGALIVLLALIAATPDADARTVRERPTAPKTLRSVVRIQPLVLAPPSPLTPEQIAKSFIFVPYTLNGWLITPGNPTYQYSTCFYNNGPFGFLEDPATCDKSHKRIYSYRFAVVATADTRTLQYDVFVTLTLDSDNNNQLHYDTNVTLGPPQCLSPFGC